MKEWATYTYPDRIEEEQNDTQDILDDWEEENRQAEMDEEILWNL